MRKILMATVGAAAVAGFTTMAAAQATNDSNKSEAKPAGAMQDQKGATGGGAVKQPGAQPAEKTLNPSSGNPSGGQSVQGPKQGPKPDERMGQGQGQGQPNGATPQRGAQDERGMQPKGAQEEKGKPDAGQHANQAPASRGGSVQLSQDQRTRIHTVIGKNSAARVTANVNFNVSVGTRVPRSVHIEVLPADFVEIVPQYEGFDYIVVGDQILIIDPDSLEIVAIIPV
jgi:Protein of unknown function (DUF1236)